MISRIAVRLRRLRRKLSRAYWSARLLGIQLPKGETDEPGLIILQIDGLSREEMERALVNGRLPFLSRLIRTGHFTLESFYSGIPSSTPAVQGEIFYGIRSAVPSFAFLNRETGSIFCMNEAASAAHIESHLEKLCPEPLLHEGRAYSNIYRGGAAHSRYCSQDLAPDLFLQRLRPLSGIILAILYAPRILRIILLALLEFTLALVDMLRSLWEQRSKANRLDPPENKIGAAGHNVLNSHVSNLWKRGEFLQELAFVPSRVLICIVLREMIRFRVLLDIESGARVIQANFLGYDEQSHRRGPDSAFAHWTLKGIDRAIRDICQAASLCAYRDYEWIIHSDHGQERTIPFLRQHGKEIETALEEVFADGPFAGLKIRSARYSILFGNARRFRRFFRGNFPETHEHDSDSEKHIVLAAAGPVGHLYFPHLLPEKEMEALALQLVAKASIPLILFRRDDSSVVAFNSRGTWFLPKDAAEVLGNQHPFLKEAAEDLTRLTSQPDAGDLVLCTWDPNVSNPMTFSLENGSHAGPGFKETHGFLLVPDRIRRWHTAHLPSTRDRVRGEDLHAIALHFLSRDTPRIERVPIHKSPVRFPRPAALREDSEISEGGLHSLRVMTYNLHSCIGLDGKARPERIARVINHCDPDLVAVQEVDAHRPRSGGHDQALAIAEHLRMEHVFHAMFEEEKERYGIAVFSRLPFEIVKSGCLTDAQIRPRREARGAIWVRLALDGFFPLHFINTHFGLGRAERRLQAETLLGDQWIGSIPENEAIILCGDFNSGPHSIVFRRFQRHLRDAQSSAQNHKPRPTFSSVKPLLRIDHVFVSRHFSVSGIELPHTPTALAASDHLPLAVELQFSSTP